MGIEALGEDKLGTLKLQVWALLMKNDAREYVSEQKVKPEIIVEGATTEAADCVWEIGDMKAHSNLVLAMNPSKLKQIKACETAYFVWQKLHTVYQSIGTVRKAALSKQLMLHKVVEQADVREYIPKLFAVVDKLQEMKVNIESRSRQETRTN